MAGQPVKDLCVKKADEGVRMAITRVPPAPGMMTRINQHVITEQFHFGVIFNNIDCVTMVHGTVADFLKL
jgi:hypothetical protein